MTDAIAQNTQQFNEKVEQIRSERDLNDQAKQRMMAEAYEEAASRHDEFVREHEEASARELADLERGVFKVAIPTSVITDADKEAYLQSYRDAAFRVLDREPAYLERVLERAKHIGDERLAQAVYHEAVERGLFDLADRYRAGRPKAQQRWEKYTAARQERESFGGILASAFSKSSGPQRPPELGRGV